MRNSKLSKIVKDQRIKLKMTQLQLAGRLGYRSAQFVSNWERGLAQPPLKKLLKLITILKLDPVKIMAIIMEEQNQQLRQALRLPKSS